MTLSFRPHTLTDICTQVLVKRALGVKMNVPHWQVATWINSLPNAGSARARNVGRCAMPARGYSSDKHPGQTGLDISASRDSEGNMDRASRAFPTRRESQCKETAGQSAKLLEGGDIRTHVRCMGRQKITHPETRAPSSS